MFLAAYWTDGGRVATAVEQEPTVIAGVVDLQSAAADVAVTLNPALTLNPPAATFVGLMDTDSALLSGRYLRVNDGGDRVSQEAPPAVLSALLTGLPGDHYLRTQVAGGVRSLQALTAMQLATALQEFLSMNLALRGFGVGAANIAAVAGKRWLVIAAGGGGGGSTSFNPGNPAAGLAGAAGGATMLATSGGEVIVTATGGDSVDAPDGNAPPAPAGGAAPATGVVIAGGGWRRWAPWQTCHQQTGFPGGAGGMAVALITPTAGNYTITVGAAGAGGSGQEGPGGAGGAGSLTILEFDD